MVVTVIKELCYNKNNRIRAVIEVRKVSEWLGNENVLVFERHVQADLWLCSLVFGIKSMFFIS